MKLLTGEYRVVITVEAVVLVSDNDERFCECSTQQEFIEAVEKIATMNLAGDNFWGDRGMTGKFVGIVSEYVVPEIIDF